MEKQQLSGGKRASAILLAFLIPGGGHMLLGRVAKGLNLLIISVLAVMAMIYYANTAGDQHLMLLVFLGLLIPSVYFYSVYDALQQLVKAVDEGQDNGFTPLQGLGLALAGIMLLALLHTPPFLARSLELAGAYAPGTALMLLGLWLCWRMAREDTAGKDHRGADIYFDRRPAMDWNMDGDTSWSCNCPVVACCSCASWPGNRTAEHVAQTGKKNGCPRTGSDCL